MNSLRILQFLAPIGVVAAIPTFAGSSADSKAETALASASAVAQLSAFADSLPAASPAAQLTTFAESLPSTLTAAPSATGGLLPVAIGADANSALNPFIQPQDPALSGNGRDQSQQFFDVLFGSPNLPSISIGRLGTDFLIGNWTIDVMIGGPEHFNPANRDKAFGLNGDDIFLWSPGDGSDRFDGGAGLDTVCFGLIGEQDAAGNIFFRVQNDQLAGDVWLDPISGLPRMDVTNSPGFCRVIDPSSSPTAAQELAALGGDRLAQFVIRGVADDFENGVQTTDNGLRVTLTLSSVEFLVCASRDGGTREAFDLRVTPPQQIPTHALPPVVNWITF